MAITSILREFVGNPNIVSIVTTDDLTAITTTGYITAQQANIELINNGEFQWTDTDLVLIYYATAQIGFFTHDATNATFDALNPSSGLSSTLQNGNIFVGNASNLAAGVTPSGDITLTNAGLFGIASGVIVNADVNASAAIDFSKLATLTSGNILVGSAGNVPTSVAMSGDATIAASGALAIAANAVTSAKTAKTLVQYTTVAITAAAFNGMYATPVQLVAAGGANTLLVLDRVELAMTYNSAAYAAGGVAAVQYDSTANGAGVIASTTNAAANFQAVASSSFAFNQGAVVAPFTTCVNKGLYLSNITGAFTTGNSAMVAHVWYKVIPTV